MRTHSVDVLVIGSGIAGLSYALRAAEHGTVAVMTKKERAESSTNYAQGGIAAVMGEDDTIELHVRDTLLAGAGLCHREAVELLARDGADRIRDLMAWGVRFTELERGLSLGREGGHSRRRVVHAADLTGREVERALRRRWRRTRACTSTTTTWPSISWWAGIPRRACGVARARSSWITGREC
jgi:L-aspartate oxidase